eukprot:TRINITY_DN8806_c0_g1_i1.p1 TRINITY_DN8806_c0_g1~~TRINITY_DN8806_c0_g1_i1.p1  ORF type:complete len:186 (-),score=17.92 TRINITY_DN8806_c0_g1_i1:218-739(-)
MWIYQLNLGLPIACSKNAQILECVSQENELIEAIVENTQENDINKIILGFCENIECYDLAWDFVQQVLNLKFKSINLHLKTIDAVLCTLDEMFVDRNLFEQLLSYCYCNYNMQISDEALQSVVCFFCENALIQNCFEYGEIFTDRTIAAARQIQLPKFASSILSEKQLRKNSG